MAKKNIDEVLHSINEHSADANGETYELFEELEDQGINPEQLIENVWSKVENLIWENMTEEEYKKTPFYAMGLINERGEPINAKGERVESKQNRSDILAAIGGALNHLSEEELQSVLQFVHKVQKTHK